jgi:hypothetical protein
MKRFWLKLSFWAVINVAAALFAVSAAFAGEISRHARQDTGIRAAMDWCTAKGGQLSWVEKAPYILSDDGATATLTGNVLVFTCKTTTASVPSWLITWTAPATREDGTTLQATEITGYQIVVNGTVLGMTQAREYIIEGVPVGSVLTLRTVAGALTSRDSVALTLAGR